MVTKLWLLQCLLFCAIRTSNFPADVTPTKSTTEVRMNESKSPNSNSQKSEDLFDDVPSIGESPPIELFNYPQEIGQFSASFRVEVEANGTKIFNFNISPNTTNCTFQMNFYVSETKVVGEKLHSANIKVYNPNNLLIDSFKYTSASKKQKLMKVKMDTVGKYKFVLKNKNDADVVIDLVLGFSECYYIKHKINKTDLTTFTNRFNWGFMKQSVC